MKNKVIFYAFVLVFFTFSGCAQLRYTIQENEHQYVIKGDIKSAYFFAKQIVQGMGYTLDAYRTVQGANESAITGVIVHPQEEMGNRVASTVLNVLFAPAPNKKDKYDDPARKVVDHYEDQRVVVIKKRWDPTGEKLADNELGVVVQGGKYGRNGQGEVVEENEISWNDPERENIGKQIQDAIDAYRKKYRK